MSCCKILPNLWLIWASLLFISLQRDLGLIMLFFRKKIVLVVFLPIHFVYDPSLLLHFYLPIHRRLHSLIPLFPSRCSLLSFTMYTHSNNPFLIYREPLKLRSHILVRICDDFCLSELGCNVILSGFTHFF